MATAFLFALERVYNYDIWWHLRTGAWILENGRVPGVDPFSFATEGAPWLPHYWLSDVFLAALHGAIGIEGLVVLKALLVALAFGLVLRAMLRDGVHPLLAALLVVLAVFTARFRFLLRPHIAMFVLAAAFYLILSRREKGERARRFALPPLQLLWTNLHGSFLLGPVLVGFRLVEEAIESLLRRRRGEAGPPRALVELAILLAVTSLLTLASPFGIGTLRWVVGDFLAKSVRASFAIQEHLPLSFGEHPLFTALLGATAASFLVAGRRFRVLHLLLFAATTFLAVRSVRYAALAALLQAPVLGANLQGALERLRGRLPAPGARVQAWIGIPALLLIAATGFHLTFTESRVYRFGIGVSESRYPGQAVEFLREAGFEGNLYNSWKFGGYLLWRLPESRTLLDGRSLDAQLELYGRLSAAGDAERRAMLEEMDVQGAVVEHGDPIASEVLASSGEFRLVFFDDRARVYLRAGPDGEGLPAGVAPFRLVDPSRRGMAAVPGLARGPLAEEAEEELRRAVAMAPGAFRPSFLLAAFLEARGEAEALVHYRDAAAANPRLAFLHYGVARRAGRLALGRRRADEAIPLLEESLRYRRDPEVLFLLGAAFQETGRSEEAEATYLTVLEEEPGQVSTLVNLGYLYLDGERLAEAEQSFARALDANPNRGEALFGRALAVERRGDRAAARALWLEFLERYPEGELADRARDRLRAIAPYRHAP